MNKIGLKEKKTRLGNTEKTKIVHDGKSAFKFNAILELFDHQGLNFKSPEVESAKEALDEARMYYETLIPDNVLTCPPNIESSEEYQYAEISKVLATAEQYGINIEKEPYLVWIARMALCLPLPSFWRKKSVGGNTVYYNMEHDVLIKESPMEGFIKAFIEKVRASIEPAERAKILNTSYMNFYDSLLRECNKQKLLEDSDTNSKYSLAATKYMENRTNPAPLKNRPRRNNEPVTDLEIITIAKACGIDPATESHLFPFIEEMIREIRNCREEVWEFRESAGVAYWTSRESKLSTPHYPFINDIKEEIEEVKREAMKGSETYKVTPKIIAELPLETQDKLKEERRRYVAVALARNENSYDASKLSEFIGKRLTREEALDYLFACPFSFGDANPVEGVTKILTEERRTEMLRRLSTKKALPLFPVTSEDKDTGKAKVKVIFKDLGHAAGSKKSSKRKIERNQANQDRQKAGQPKPNSTNKTPTMVNIKRSKKKLEESKRRSSTNKRSVAPYIKAKGKESSGTATPIVESLQESVVAAESKEVSKEIDEAAVLPYSNGGNKGEDDTPEHKVRLVTEFIMEAEKVEELIEEKHNNEGIGGSNIVSPVVEPEEITKTNPETKLLDIREPKQNAAISPKKSPSPTIEPIKATVIPAANESALSSTYNENPDHNIDVAPNPIPAIITRKENAPKEEPKESGKIPCSEPPLLSVLNKIPQLSQTDEKISSTTTTQPPKLSKNVYDKPIRLKLLSKSFMQRRAHTIKSSLKKRDQSHNECHDDFDAFLEQLLEKHGGYTKHETTKPAKNVRTIIRRTSIEGNKAKDESKDPEVVPLIINLPKINTYPIPDNTPEKDSKSPEAIQPKEHAKETLKPVKLCKLPASVPSSPNATILTTPTETGKPIYQIKQLKLIPEQPSRENERKNSYHNLVSFESARTHYLKNFTPQKYRPQIKVLVKNDHDALLKSRLFLNNEDRKAMTPRIRKGIYNDIAYKVFSFYVATLGDPTGGKSGIKIVPPCPGATPGNVLKMGRRLGILPSTDPDLMWIPHLQLSIKTQPSGEIKQGSEEICNMEIGEHPGDVYFYFLVQMEKARRIISKEEVENIIVQSWLPFKNYKGTDMSYYYYNFATKEISFEDPQQKATQTPYVSQAKKIDIIFEKAYSLFQYYKVNNEYMTF